MTLNGVIAFILRYYVTVVEDRPRNMVYAKYRLPVIFGQN